MHGGLTPGQRRGEPGPREGWGGGRREWREGGAPAGPRPWERQLTAAMNRLGGLTGLGRGQGLHSHHSHTMPSPGLGTARRLPVPRETTQVQSSEGRQAEPPTRGDGAGAALPGWARTGTGSHRRGLRPGAPLPLGTSRLTGLGKHTSALVCGSERPAGRL